MSKFADCSDAEIAAAMAEVAAHLADLCYFMILRTVNVPDAEDASHDRAGLVDRMNELGAELNRRADND